MARIRQPQGAITVNRGNQLAEGLTHLYTSGLPVDFAKNALLSGPRLDPLPGFLGLYGGNASATKYQLLDDSLSTTGDLTVGALFFANETTAAQGVFNRTQESGSYPQNWNIYVYNGQIKFQGSHDGYTSVSADIVAGTPYLVVGRHINSSREWSIWLNGIKVQYRTAVGVLDTSGGAQTTQIGATNSGALPLNGGVYLAVGYKRALADSEIVSLSNNPWQLFAPQRRIWVQIPATGSSTVDATATGATVVASSSAIAGALTAASSATAVTVAASASAIAGAATAASAPAAATVTATASAISGATTGAGQSAAATVAATASATGGAVTAASATTAATVAASSSALSGAATGTASGTATGATVVANAEIIDGSATGNAAGTANGAIVAASVGAIAGAMNANAEASGQAVAVATSAIAGALQADYVATGAVVSASATAIPGAVATGTSATAFGATATATVTYLSGAIAAASSAAGWTQVVTAIAARGVAYGALPDVDPRYLVPSRKRRFTVQARGRRFNART